MSLLNQAISGNISIREAIKILINIPSKNLFIEDKKKIIGVFTEGDFRNAVLKGIDINKEIKTIVNKKFKYVTKNDPRSKIIKIFRENSLIQNLPILSQKNVLEGIIERDNFLIKKIVNIKI